MNKPGFTLIEVLVAGSVFLVLSSAFVSLFIAGNRAVNSAGVLNQAVRTLTGQMEELHAQVFSAAARNPAVTVVAPDLLAIEIQASREASRPPVKLWTLRSAY